jgi:hypothetical protein
VETLSDELGASLRRLDRWKDDFVAGGSEALAQRKDLEQSWWARNRTGIVQWLWFLLALVDFVALLWRFMQRSPDEQIPVY